MTLPLSPPCPYPNTTLFLPLSPPYPYPNPIEGMVKVQCEGRSIWVSTEGAVKLKKEGLSALVTKI